MARRLIVVPFDIPVDPSSPEAQEWLREELSRPEYQAAKPTWFDLASKAVFDWIRSLFTGPAGNATSVIVVAILLVLAGLIVAAFLIYGRPRFNRRSADERSSLFGSELRTARELRASSESAARAGDWATAIEERFRAIAAALHERTLVRVSPGTTATEFSRRAAAVFGDEAYALLAAARSFDEVRYLERPGTESAYQQAVALDQRLEAARVALPAVPV
ncbi:DUF4129 domain-containing protein [Leifsonia sp. C5G2]|uniref:DUF4129 domain-containing protein n=1 Tax=Leifsonia sp. C5G2 TaxID=2735269 RepID=UPI001585AC77|nr:DUF4129 domain-containing protein [Leifsonia sp. C5G2]